MVDNRRISLRIPILGLSYVGKTQIMNRFILNNFNPSYHETTRANFLTKELELENKIATIEIWDTIGLEHTHSLGRSFLRGTNAIILVYSCDSNESLESLKTIFETNKNYYPSEHIYIIFANKKDSNNRQVSYEKGLQFATNINAGFFEVSAMTGENIEEAFRSIINKCLIKLN
ncbi:hypothetical protein SteCoe_17701 [Stentor coeruleus]|uniref:Uncharacterized protein n=1 Tax=Stentor coeruleus TaxID=5963 RepID=A0A1R2BY68_9CILI|nr:hypothetical protein SteCoe_17701 [Stentor coeruleus]